MRAAGLGEFTDAEVRTEGVNEDTLPVTIGVTVIRIVPGSGESCSGFDVLWSDPNYRAVGNLWHPQFVVPVAPDLDQVVATVPSLESFIHPLETSNGFADAVQVRGENLPVEVAGPDVRVALEGAEACVL